MAVTQFVNGDLAFASEPMSSVAVQFLGSFELANQATSQVFVLRTV